MFLVQSIFTVESVYNSIGYHNTLLVIYIVISCTKSSATVNPSLKKIKYFPFRMHRKTLLNPSKLKNITCLTKEKKLYSNPLRYEEDLELIIMG